MRKVANQNRLHIYLVPKSVRDLLDFADNNICFYKNAEKLEQWLISFKTLITELETTTLI